MKDKFIFDVFDKYNYILHYLRYKVSKIPGIVLPIGYWSNPKMVAGKLLLSTPKTNELIGQKITDGVPFWAGRFGGTEMNMIYQVLLYRMHPHKDNRQDAVSKLCMYSGFFPNDISLGEKFVDLMLKDCKHIDLLAEWRRYMENYIYIKYQPFTKLTQLSHLEPWNMYKYSHSNVKPWSSALKGKRVLVIHPFEESIRKQYNNRKKIFERVFNSDDILPDFELITLKAVQTLGGKEDRRFRTWFDALDWMIRQCHEIKFDVAIVGCGAYGFPLAAEIKRMGKTVIHLGGATQILFGIIGTRWEVEYEHFHTHVVNDYWVRPLETERISNAEAIESACYW